MDSISTPKRRKSKKKPKLELQKLLYARIEELYAKHKVLYERRQQLDIEARQLENDMAVLKEVLGTEAKEEVSL